MKLYTVGHSNRGLEEFIDLLKEYGIELLVDVRSVPYSSRFPHFSKRRLSTALKEGGIDYLHIPELGGLREVPYTKYTETEDFKRALDRLTALSEGRRTVIMCAEKRWTECHRRFIAQELVRKGVEVIHIISVGRAQTHPKSLY